MRVMIVDEDQELSRLLRLSLCVGFYEKAKHLAREGKKVTESLEVAEFTDQAKALDYLAQETATVDLIFADVYSGKVEGTDFLGTCREKYREKYRDIILVMDPKYQAEIKRGLQAGAKDCILKPFKPEALLAHVFHAWKSI